MAKKIVASTWFLCVAEWTKVHRQNIFYPCSFCLCSFVYWLKLRFTFAHLLRHKLKQHFKQVILVKSYYLHRSSRIHFIRLPLSKYLCQHSFLFDLIFFVCPVEKFDHNKRRDTLIAILDSAKLIFIGRHL